MMSTYCTSCIYIILRGSLEVRHELSKVALGFEINEISATKRDLHKMVCLSHLSAEKAGLKSLLSPATPPKKNAPPKRGISLNPGSTPSMPTYTASDNGCASLQRYSPN
jgi:hypothetical protein